MPSPSAPSRYRLLAASLVLGALLVIADAAMDAYVDLWDWPRPEDSWGERFLEELLDPSLREVWIRSFVLLLCVGFGGFAVLERQRSERHLAALAYRDALTGLPNRADFLERLAAEIGHAQRHHRAFALIFLDLDHFKVVNDSLGHDRGDELLRAVAHRLSTALRPEDLLARLGGDEFVLLVRSVASPFDITALAQRLVDLLAQPFVIDGKEVFLGASAGISLFPQNGTDASNLIRRADAAMYHAKGCGRNNIRFYTPELNARLGERNRMQGELRKALALGEFELDYRPQLALPGREIVGAEAVLRWRREGEEYLPPDRFLPFAEEAGVAIPLGQWVVRTACAQLRAWRESGVSPPYVAVSVSSHQLSHADFVGTVEDAVRTSRARGCDLVLEISEAALLRDVEQTVAKLASLRQLGVRVALDDFGTGYSSMSALRSLPIAYLKIDARFVQRIGESEGDTRIVRAIIALGHSLGLQVVADGVETAAQLAFLEAERCDIAQGHYLERGLVGASLTERLRLA